MRYDDPLYQTALNRLADKADEHPMELFPYIENDVNILAIDALWLAEESHTSETFQNVRERVQRIRKRAIDQYQRDHVEDMIEVLRQEQKDMELP